VAACSVATDHRLTHAAAKDQGNVAVIRPSLGRVSTRLDAGIERAEAGGDRSANQAAHGIDGLGHIPQFSVPFDVVIRGERILGIGHFRFQIRDGQIT
jgi:hypothetical protein